MGFFSRNNAACVMLFAALAFVSFYIGRSLVLTQGRTLFLPLHKAAWFDFGSTSSQRNDAVNSGAEGDRSEEKSLLHGIDISSYTRAIPPDVWQQMHQDGWDFVIASAWQGRHQNRFARQQLEGARLAGMKTAGYCLLNFDHPKESGQWQVQQAIQALGSEPVSFLAIDVELPRNFKLCVKCVERIHQGVEAAKKAGLRPVIYASRQDWKHITRDACNPDGSLDFHNIPLWGARWDEDDRLNLDRYEDWQSYGGWDNRIGKQYADNKSFTAEMFQFRYSIPAVDLNIFDAAIFREAPVIARQIAPAPLTKVVAAPRTSHIVHASVNKQQAVCL